MKKYLAVLMLLCVAVMSFAQNVNQGNLIKRITRGEQLEFALLKRTFADARTKDAVVKAAQQQVVVRKNYNANWNAALVSAMTIDNSDGVSYLPNPNTDRANTLKYSDKAIKLAGQHVKAELYLMRFSVKVDAARFNRDNYKYADDGDRDAIRWAKTHPNEAKNMLQEYEKAESLNRELSHSSPFIYDAVLLYKGIGKGDKAAHLQQIINNAQAKRQAAAKKQIQQKMQQRKNQQKKQQNAGFWETMRRIGESGVF